MKNVDFGQIVLYNGLSLCQNERIRKRGREMGLWKNLKYVLSDECNGLLRLLVDHYNRRSEKNEKSIHDVLIKVQQMLDTQEVLDNNMSDSYRELRENKEDISKVSSQCESVFSRCETIVSQISQMET